MLGARFMSIKVLVNTCVSPLEDLYKRCSVSTSSCTKCFVIEVVLLSARVYVCIYLIVSWCPTEPTMSLVY